MNKARSESALVGRVRCWRIHVAVLGCQAWLPLVSQLFASHEGALSFISRVVPPLPLAEPFWALASLRPLAHSRI